MALTKSPQIPTAVRFTALVLAGSAAFLAGCHKEDFDSMYARYASHQTQADVESARRTGDAIVHTYAGGNVLEYTLPDGTRCVQMVRGVSCDWRTP